MALKVKSEGMVGGGTPCLELMSGSDKGRVFEMSSGHLTIGRHENNDVVIVSEAVSRYHAVMEQEADGGVVIRDNDSKNGVLVNGNKLHATRLQNGDVVQVGNFVFRFYETEVADPTAEPYASGAMNDNGYVAEVVPMVTKPRGRRSNRPLIYGFLALVLGYAYYASQSDKPAADPATPEADTAAVAPAAGGKLTPPQLDLPKEGNVPQLEDPALSKVEQKLDKMDLGNSSIKESEAYFRKGQREYLNKNYHRAIEDFRASLSLYRNHELAQYYLRLSVYEVEQDAKKNMETGRKYFESMQYSRAMFHFKQVESLMEHRPTDPMVGEADKYILQCERRLEAAEQFP